MQPRVKTVLYFGNIDMSLSRNKIYVEGLRANGIRVLTCVDHSKGLLKYVRLFKKHWELRHAYDVLIVGYSGYITVPFAKLITRKPVVFDALCSFYEGEILSRDALKEVPFRVTFVRLIDWFATRCADVVLVETLQQKKYFQEELGVRPGKCVTVYTGVDDTTFFIDETVSKHRRFTVLFRGRIMSEAGVPTIVRTAKILENKDIDFLIIGYGCNEAMREFNKALASESPKNVQYIGEQLPVGELRTRMLQCHVSLGQFADHERLIRTIPHKAFESLAMKLPYITARTAGISEILVDGESCLMVNPADPKDLAEKILHLYEDRTHSQHIAEAGFALYQERFCPKMVVAPLVELVTMNTHA